MDVEVTDKINTITCDSLTSFVTLHCNLIEFRKTQLFLKRKERLLLDAYKFDTVIYVSAGKKCFFFFFVSWKKLLDTKLKTFISYSYGIILSIYHLFI